MFRDSEQMIEPTCVTSYSKGFIVGGENLTILMFKLNQETSQFSIIERFRVFDNNLGLEKVFSDDLKETVIRSIHIDYKTEEKLLVITQNRSVFSCNLPKETDDIDSLHDRGVFKLVADTGHSDKITCADTCSRKPYIVTCADDKTLKLWDYKERELILTYTFPEKAVAVTYHPSGYHVVVGFQDKIQFLNLYLNGKDQGRRDFRRITTKNCTCLKFSHGGGLLATSSGLSSQAIAIFKFYANNSQAIHTFNGHSGHITDLEWGNEDIYLYSCGKNGLIIRWNMRNGERHNIIPTKGVGILSMVLSVDNKTIICVKDDRESLVVDGKCDNPGPIYNTVAITNSDKIIFIGNKANPDVAGNIGFEKHPRTGRSTMFTRAHDYRGVSKILITNDDKHLITCGGDGTIIMFDIKDQENKDGSMDEGFKDPCNNIMVTKQEIDELDAQKNNLMSSLEDEKGSDSNGMEVGGEKIKEQIKGLNDEIKNKSSSSKNRNDQKVKEKEKKEILNQKALDELIQKCETELKDLDVYFTSGLSEKQETIKDLVRQTEEKDNEIKKNYEEEMRNHQDAIEKEMRDFNNKILKERDNKKMIQREIEEKKIKQAEEISFIEQETKKEYDDLEKKFQEEVEKLKNKTIKLKNKSMSHTKNYDKHVQAIEVLKESYTEKEKTEAQLEEKVALLKLENQELESHLKKMNSKITLKEKKIYELKRRTQELEKYKFVLDFKIKDLKRDIVPKQAEIKNLKLQITLKDRNLKKFNDLNNKLGLVVENLEEEQDDLLKKIKKQKVTLIEQNHKIRNFKNNLYDAVQDILNYKILKEKLIKMNDKKIKKQEINNDIFKEYKSQLRYLEKSVNMLKRNLDKDSEIHKEDNMRIMKTNVDLIKEINTLRLKVKEENKSDKPELGMNKPAQKFGSDQIMQDILAQKKFRAETLRVVKNILEDVRQLEKIHKLEWIEVDEDVLSFIKR